MTRPGALVVDAPPLHRREDSAGSAPAPLHDSRAANLATSACAASIAPSEDALLLA